MKVRTVIFRLMIAILSVVLSMALVRNVDNRVFGMIGSALIIFGSTMLAHKIK